jgi:hypothetical protein
MYTWISKAIVGLPVVLLAACGSLEGALPSFSRLPRADSKIESVGPLKIVLPADYCSDILSSKDRFSVVLPCKALSDKVDDWPGFIAVFTTLVGDKAPPYRLGHVDSIEAALRSTDGRTAISRLGNPRSVDVLSIWPQSEALYVRVKDTSATPFGRGYIEHWRALSVVAGQSVVVTVGGYGKNQLTEPDGLRVLQRFVKRMKEANL